MEVFQKHAIISNTKNPELFFENDFWIDTGALYTFVPEDFLENIKVEPTRTVNLFLADNRTIKQLFGYCSIQIEGIEDINICPVVFAPKESMFLLGATALENFGLQVDPVNKKLIPINAIIA